MGDNIKGKCIICKTIVDVSTLNDSSVMVSVIIPVVCKNCNDPDGEEESRRNTYAKNSGKRRYTKSAE